MRNFFYVVFIFALLQGCADTINDPAGNDLNIEILKPANNDTLGYKGDIIDYELKVTGGINFIELYVNNEFIRNYPPVNNQKPVINFEIDSSFTGKRVELYLIFFDKNGSSYKSNTVKNIFVAEDRTKPAAPVGLQILLLSNTSLNLSWQDNSPFITGYEIWRSEGSNNNFIEYLTVQGTARNVNDTNLTQGVVYYYKIRGISKNGVSEFSNIVNSEGSGGSSQPANLNAVVKDFCVIALSWKDNSTNENYFKIERRRPWTYFESIGYAEANSESFIDSSEDISGGADYFYRVKAVSERDSSWSNEAYIYMPSYVLKPPSIISVENTTSRIVTIRWKDNDQHWTDFIIERKSEGGEFTEIKRTEGSVFIYKDAVIPQKNYTYRIKEDDGVYNSSYSNEMGITTVVVPLPAPGNLNGYYDGNSMIITWEYNFEADKFSIERRDSTAGGTYTEVSVVSGNEKEFIDNNTLCQHIYVYRLKALDPYSVSPYSPEKVIKNWKTCP